MARTLRLSPKEPSMARTLRLSPKEPGMARTLYLANNNMLDIKYIRENKDEVKRGVANKQYDPSLVDKILLLDEKRRKLLSEVEGLRAERNKIKKERTEEAKKLGKKIKESLKKIEPELRDVAKEFKEVLHMIPNPPADDVKVGKDDSENEVIRKWEEPKKFDFKPKDHLEIGEALNIIDVERASKVSGSRFAYLKGDAVLLEFALVQYAMKTLIGEGFYPVVTPVLMKKESMEGMGYFEYSGADDMFVLEKDGLVLAGTSEQVIGPMHMNEVLSAKELPKRYVGFSSCFRREAGSYGKDTRGIFRVHQFDKVEMFSFTKEGESDDEHEFMLGMEEKLLQALKIPYQVVKMCTGDVGLPFTRKYDIEAWMPGQGKYREVTSTSNAGDYQARRLNIKYQEKGENKY
ncbi:MAG: serine--tRNA ligase, partial [Candidatus Hodarchaeales archaeon]